MKSRQINLYTEKLLLRGFHRNGYRYLFSRKWSYDFDENHVIGDYFMTRNRSVGI